MRTYPSRGFSLIELMVVVAILGIAMAFAVPTMRDLLANQRMKSASFNLVISAMFARSEAVSRGIPVTIKAPSSNNLTGGWCVLIDATASCDLTTPDANTMRIQSPVDGVTYAFRTTAAPITFSRYGRLTNLVRVEITDDVDSGMKRCVTIDVGGNAVASSGECPA